MSEPNKNEWDKREIGALWVKTSADEKTKFFTGEIDGRKVVVFKNKHKDKNPKGPDLRIYLSEESARPAQPTAARPATPAPRRAPTPPAPAPVEEPSKDIF